MEIQLIRSATVRVSYAGRRFIFDPYLAARHTRPSYRGVSPNPLVDLPCPPLEVLAGIEMAVISHLHSDHFDPVGQDLLPKDTPILCQPGDGAALAGNGFLDVTPVDGEVVWKGITITRAPGQHGTGEVLKEMGKASGFVLEAANEPTLYWAGDTIWCDTVADVIARARPDVIVTHSCGAVWGDNVLIVMDAAQTVAVCCAAPLGATVVATHMEALDHATVSRRALREYAESQGIGPDRLLIPLDGETMSFAMGRFKRAAESERQS